MEKTRANVRRLLQPQIRVKRRWNGKVGGKCHVIDAVKLKVRRMRAGLSKTIKRSATKERQLNREKKRQKTSSTLEID